MTRLIWDQVGRRTYEGGLDRGVIYSQDGRVIPWNGLVSVVENFNNSVTPVYFDGQKITNFTTPGTFSATINAITYPDILPELEGLGSINSAVFVSDQRPTPFHLSYRTHIGNDIEDRDVGYKIHILYNVTAIPAQRTYQTFNSSPSLVNFSWDITAVPEELPGLLPSAHLIIDASKLESSLLEQVETIIYGGDVNNPYLPSLSEMFELINSWFKVQIIDNDDGTWTATTNYDGYITFLDDGKFRIDGVTATYLDANTYIISDTTF